MSITTAAVTSTNGIGIFAELSSNATDGLEITTTGAVMGNLSGIEARNYGSGATSITAASVSGMEGIGILTRTIAGASVTVNTGGTVSGAAGMNAIQTSSPESDSTSTPADSITIMGSVTGSISTEVGADIVTLAAGSTTTGITIDLGAGDDRLDLASTAFGTLDGGADTDTLSVSGTGITLEGGAHSNFETLIFEAGSNTLSGTHTGLTVTNFNAGTTILTGSLASTTAAVALGATLDLAAGSSLTGDLSNSGMLTVAGSGFGSATITGDLVLNADGSLTLDTNGAGGETDLLMVSGAVTLGGTLALRQTTMPAGTVTLIDGGTALSGNFASSNEMSTEGLVNGLLISQTLVQDGINFDLQLVTTVTTPVPMPDPEFPTGCTVTPTSPLAAGGTLTCISGSPITEAIATNVDGVTIIIGESGTQTTVMPASGDALSATIASTSAAGNISINSEFGTISGGANGIVASTAGSGSISITSASVTGNANRGIDAGLSNSGATGDLRITASGAVTGGSDSIYAFNAGTGTTSITVASVSATSGVGILTRTRAGASITVNAGGTVSGGGGMNAIETQAPSGDSSSTPSDTVTVMGTVTGGNILTLTGADTVTLAATSTTTGITIDLGTGDDRLDLASANFGTLDGGPGADTLSVTGTGITLAGDAHSNFETLIFTAGSNTLSGTHTGLASTIFNAGTTTLAGSLTSATATVASGATLDLAAGSSLAGDLVNSGMLTVAGSRLWKRHYHRRPRAECGRKLDPRYRRDGQRERQAHGERRGHARRNFSATANDYACWNSHTD